MARIDCTPATAERLLEELAETFTIAHRHCPDAIAHIADINDEITEEIRRATLNSQI